MHPVYVSIVATSLFSFPPLLPRSFSHSDPAPASSAPLRSTPLHSAFPMLSYPTYRFTLCLLSPSFPSSSLSLIASACLRSCCSPFCPSSPFLPLSLLRLFPLSLRLLFLPHTRYDPSSAFPTMPLASPLLSSNQLHQDRHMKADYGLALWLATMSDL